MTLMKANYSLKSIAAHLGAELRCVGGDELGNKEASGVATLMGANNRQIAFLANPRYRAQLADTKALAVIASEAVSADVPVHCLVHSEPYRAYAELTQLFEQRPSPAEGVHPSACIGEHVVIGEGAKIAAGVVIHDHVVIGCNAEILANAVIESGSTLGDEVFIGAHVTLAHGVTLGNQVRIQAGTVVGSEGFGYAPFRDASDGGVRWQRIAQLGSVVIGNRVEIGANTSIDRGALDNTIIEDDVIIDNQVQVAHNVKIGRGTAIAGCVGIAGSATIGRECSIGGGAGIAGHLTIADGTTVLGMTLINRSVNKAGVYASGTGMQEAATWRKSAVRFTQLEQLNKRVKALEQQLENKTGLDNSKST